MFTSTLKHHCVRLGRPLVNRTVAFERDVTLNNVSHEILCRSSNTRKVEGVVYLKNTTLATLAAVVLGLNQH